MTKLYQLVLSGFQIETHEYQSWTTNPVQRHTKTIVHFLIKAPKLVHM